MVRVTVALALLGATLVSGFRKRRKNATASASSCSDKCNAGFDGSNDCQCNSQCAKYSSCCTDFSPVCQSKTCDGNCGNKYDKSDQCQCNDDCNKYGNCCSDYMSICRNVGGGPGPAPPSPGPVPSPVPPPVFATPAPTPATLPPGAVQYWKGINTGNIAALQQRMTNGHRKLSYGALWITYKSVWVNLPGQCQGRIFDVYSKKCWTAGSSQCGSYRKEGDCYNREHSWPKSWWNRVKNIAYSDMFHVMPSDGYVNGKRGSFPFGEVSSPTYTSSEGNKVGPCTTSGYSGTCFEPTDRVKGLMARGHMYMGARYANFFPCCAKDAVDGAEMKSWTKQLMIKWDSNFPAQNWEMEMNDRIQQSQGNRNAFIDFPGLGASIYGR